MTIPNLEGMKTHSVNAPWLRSPTLLPLSLRFPTIVRLSPRQQGLPVHSSLSGYIRYWAVPLLPVSSPLLWWGLHWRSTAEAPNTVISSGRQGTDC